MNITKIFNSFCISLEGKTKAVHAVNIFLLYYVHRLQRLLLVILQVIEIMS